MWKQTAPMVQTRVEFRHKRHTDGKLWGFLSKQSPSKTCNRVCSTSCSFFQNSELKKSSLTRSTSSCLSVHLWTQRCSKRWIKAMMDVMWNAQIQSAMHFYSTWFIRSSKAHKLVGDFTVPLQLQCLKHARKINNRHAFIHNWTE